jgi:RND family efflux transporter MFP subunit
VTLLKHLIISLLSFSWFITFAWAEEPETITPLQAVSVSSKALEDLTYFPRYSAPAKVISLNNSRISALINAPISAIKVQVGDQVKAGQTLVSLDCSDMKLSHSATLSRLKLARKEYSRLRKLKKTVTEQRTNAAETNLALAQNAFNTTKLHVSRCKVLAPFNGVVTSKHASLGELAAPGTPLITIIDTDHIEVSAQVSQIDSVSLSQAKKTLFTWAGLSFAVKTRSQVAVIMPHNRNREVRLIFVNKTPLPGAAGSINWHDNDAHINADMLSERDGQLGIFVLEGNKARFTALPHALPGHPVKIDLPSQTRIIIDGRFGLIDGTSVKNQEL